MSVMHSQYPPLLELKSRAYPIFLVTAMREPLARILSSFHYEGKSVMHKVVPVSSFQQWVDDMNKHARGQKTSNLWASVSDYYTRVFAGEPGGTSLNDQHYRQAAYRLASFDAVFITERFSVTSSNILVKALLPPVECGNISAGLLQPNRPLGALSHDAMTTHVNGNTHKSQTLGPLTVKDLRREDPATSIQLERLNMFDLKLYDFACKLNALQVRLWTRAFEDPQQCSSCSALPSPLPKLGVRIAPRLDDASRAPNYKCLPVLQGKTPVQY